MRKLEALADAITHYSGYNDPSGESYRARNPGLLRAWSMRHQRTNSDYRIFRSFIDGYQALLYDLQIKCSGQSRSKLQPNSTLQDLMAAYNFPATMAQFIAKFLRKALEDETIAATTPLSFFIED